jgi:hypothetical protein
MAIQLIAKLEDSSALIDIQNDHASRTVVREITGSRDHPLQPGWGWCRCLDTGTRSCAN